MQLANSSFGPAFTGRLEEVTCPLLLSLGNQSSLTGEIEVIVGDTVYEISLEEGHFIGMVKNGELLSATLLEQDERDRISVFVKEIALMFTHASGSFRMTWREQPKYSHVSPDRVPMPFLLRYGLARTTNSELLPSLFQAIFPFPTTIKLHATRDIIQLMGGKVEEELEPYKQGQTVIPGRTPESLQQALLVLWSMCLLESDHTSNTITHYYNCLQVLRQPPIDALPMTFEAFWPLDIDTSTPSSEMILDLEEIVVEEETPAKRPAAVATVRGSGASAFAGLNLTRDATPAPREVDLIISDELLAASKAPELFPLLLENMETWRASDLFVSTGKSPAVRVHGSIHTLELPPTKAEQFEHFQAQILTPETLQRLQSEGDLDVGYSPNPKRRFRLNFHRQQGQWGLVARAIPSGKLTFQDLNLPPQLQTLASQQRGLILVTGATGSGKSTTLAAMLHHINATRQAHIVTIEEPIEFVHEEVRSRITQREVGSDTQSFHAALRHVVRESPDVIMIGEMRDQETMSVALSAALTGHLVLATLHTINAVQTLQRIMSYYPEHLRHQVATDLSLSLRGIVSQRLIPNINGTGRVIAVEMLTATPAVGQLLRNQRIDELADVLENDNDPGIQSFNSSLTTLFRRGKISYEMGRAYSTNPEQFALLAQGMSTGVGTFRGKEKEEESSNLDIQSLLEVTMEKGASDLHLTVGRPPIFRINGALVPMKCAPLSEGDMRTLLYSALSTPQRTAYQLEREIDFALAVRSGQRFRINAYYQKGQMAASLRAIPSEIPDPRELSVPESILEMVDAPHGLLLVTGPTGSGKSTTLACMIDRINRSRPCRIITIEDPIEFTHRSRMATIDQREVMSDTKSFASALKYILRQDPDVILIGEMRDQETIRAALTAAETGHLVLATLHTNSAVQTIARIVDVFSDHQQPQIRSQLSTSLLGVVSQRLLPRKEGKGRIPAFEIMMASPAIRNLIREDKMHQALGIMESSRSMGMITLDTFLQRLYEAGVVSYQDALRYITNPTLLQAPAETNE
ncbi:MAG: PilT/PilU family type 4a pilus ATPase [Deltaproteobacteria bacterium]|nr:MAG: PilT/PilU family type 4a pilus ATPase [Deltaproteobacteria bacterium]